jgi:hypothetical protein
MDHSEYKMVLEQEPLIILDANVLLELYRVSEYACNGLIEKIENVLSFIWLPSQVRDEYYRNYKHIQSKMDKRFAELSKGFDKSITEFKKSAKDDIKSVINGLKRYSYKEDDVKELIDFESEFEVELQKIVDLGKNFNSKLSKLQTKDMIEKQKNAVDNLVKKFNYGLPLTLERKLQIAREGELRYKYKIPPGFKDEETKDHRDGLDKFGDLFLWKEVLEYASKADNDNVILVTNDAKEDWKIKKNGSKFRPELYREFNDYCPDKQIHFMNLSDFYSLSEHVDNLIKLEINADTYVRNYLFGEIQEEIQEKLFGYFIEHDFTDMHDDYYRNNNGDAERLDDLKLEEVKVVVDELEVEYALSVSLPAISYVSYEDNEGMVFSLGDISADVVARVIVTFDLKDGKRVNSSRLIELEDFELQNIYSRDLYDVYADDESTAHAEQMEVLEEYYNH